MTLALLDCPTGLAGNMLLAALLDLGVPEEVIHRPLSQLDLAGRYRLGREERRSGGLRGLHLTVESLEKEPHHRPWGQLRRTIADSNLDPGLRERVMAVFSLLAEAEGRVHGHSPDQVHFHEVGGIDALVDVVGVCAALMHLNIQQLICAAPPAGHGTVLTAHGILPLPAPAVLEMARLRGIPLASSEGFPPGELTTPTGLALVACWAERFGPHPGAVPMRIGVGLGSRSSGSTQHAAPAPGPIGRGEPEQREGEGEPEPLLLQQAQIDDATAEDLAFLAEALRQAGALGVFSQPILMKKGRLGTLLTALMPPALGPRLRRVWWRQGTTLGVREQLQQRWTLPRQSSPVPTSLGPVRLKGPSCPMAGNASRLNMKTWPPWPGVTICHWIRCVPRCGRPWRKTR